MDIFEGFYVEFVLDKFCGYILRRLYLFMRFMVLIGCFLGNVWFFDFFRCVLCDLLFYWGIVYIIFDGNVCLFYYDYIFF